MKKSTLFILGVAFSHSLAFSQGRLPEGTLVILIPVL